MNLVVYHYSMSIKNFWSLSVDETLFVSEFKEKFRKTQYETFFPTNAQLKDIDLLLLDLQKMKINTIQVKGSRTYKPKINERKKFGSGSGAWFVISYNTIFHPSNKIDFFVFVLHSFSDGQNKKEIQIDYLIIPSEAVKEITQKKRMVKGQKYHFFIWIDHSGKRAYEFYESLNQPIELSKFLNNWDILGK